jgi:hypothetical protein
MVDYESHAPVALLHGKRHDANFPVGLSTSGQIRLAVENTGSKEGRILNSKIRRESQERSINGGVFSHDNRVPRRILEPKTEK